MCKQKHRYIVWGRAGKRMSKDTIAEYKFYEEARGHVHFIMKNRTNHIQLGHWYRQGLISHVMITRECVL